MLGIKISTLLIKSTWLEIILSQLLCEKTSVADPVHFGPDPDPDPTY